MSASAASALLPLGCSSGAEVSSSSQQDQLLIAASSKLRRISREDVAVSRPSSSLSGDTPGQARRLSNASNNVASMGAAPAPVRRRMSNPNNSPARPRRMSNPNNFLGPPKSEDGSLADEANTNISLRTFGQVNYCADQIAANAVKNELVRSRASFVAVPSTFEAGPESGSASQVGAGRRLSP